jgi:hypothetical protein
MGNISFTCTGNLVTFSSFYSIEEEKFDTLPIEYDANSGGIVAYKILIKNKDKYFSNHNNALWENNFLKSDIVPTKKNLNGIYCVKNANLENPSFIDFSLTLSFCKQQKSFMKQLGKYWSSSFMAGSSFKDDIDEEKEYNSGKYILVKILLCGKVIEYDLGYRAENAYILEEIKEIEL